MKRNNNVIVQIEWAIPLPTIGDIEMRHNSSDFNCGSRTNKSTLIDYAKFSIFNVIKAFITLANSDSSKSLSLTFISFSSLTPQGCETALEANLHTPWVIQGSHTTRFHTPLSAPREVRKPRVAGVYEDRGVPATILVTILNQFLLF